MVGPIRASKSTGARERRSQKKIRTAEKNRILEKKSSEKEKRGLTALKKKFKKHSPSYMFLDHVIIFVQTHFFTLDKMGQNTVFAASSKIPFLVNIPC